MRTKGFAAAMATLLVGYLALQWAFSPTSGRVAESAYAGVSSNDGFRNELPVFYYGARLINLVSLGYVERGIERNALYQGAGVEVGKVGREKSLDFIFTILIWAVAVFSFRFYGRPQNGTGRAPR